MTGIRAVQAFRRERANNRTYGDLAEQYRENTARTMGLTGVYDPALKLIGNLTVATALAIGGFRVVDGSMEVGVVVATLLYTNRLFPPSTRMAMFYNSFPSAAAPLEKIPETLR